MSEIRTDMCVGCIRVYAQACINAKHIKHTCMSVHVCMVLLHASDLVTCIASPATCCQDKLLVDSNMGIDVSGGGDPSSG